MIHPDTQLRFMNEKVGYGVFATKFIPEGTITWALDKLDRIFTPRHINSLDPIYQEILEKYTYRNSKGEFIFCWDMARYVNHSFNSNCITTAYEFELAVQDIYPGEELTDDYGYLNISEPFDCEPEKDSDRKRVYPDDLLRYHGEWDKKLIEAFKFFNSVKQPLKQFILPEYRNKVERIAKGEIPMDSILQCYFNPANEATLQKNL